MTSYEKSPKTYQVVDAIVEALSSQTPRIGIWLVWMHDFFSLG